MKYAVSVTFTLALLVSLLVPASATAGEFIPARQNALAGEYLVALETNAARMAIGDSRAELPPVAEVAERLQRDYGGKILSIMDHSIAGFSVQISEAAARALATDPAVKFVEQNAQIKIPTSTTDFCYTGSTPPSQNLPIPSSPQYIDCDTTSVKNCKGNWGLDRIDQQYGGGLLDQRYTFNGDASDVHVYVVDTGVQGTHSEFQDANGNSRVIGGASFNTNTAPNTDCHGHGTHVASIIAGKTYGVAKNAIIHPVKFNSEADLPDHESCSESTNTSDQARAMEWVAQNYQLPAVVNFSSNPGIGAFLDGQVANLISLGIPVVQSAGNNSTDASNYLLGRTQYLDTTTLIVAGASDEVDARWEVVSGDGGDEQASSSCPGGSHCGSNYGSLIDVFSPGAHITAASWQGTNTYCRLSGTSMAAPHVTGVIALYLEKVGQQSPAAIENRLKSSATKDQLTNIGPKSPNLLLSTATADSKLAACFTGDCTANSCTLNAGCSTVDSDANITRYEWDFGDGSTATTYGPYATHDYGVDGYWTATVEIVVDTGERAEESHCVNTYNFGIAGCIQ